MYDYRIFGNHSMQGFPKILHYTSMRFYTCFSYPSVVQIQNEIPILKKD